ncbi:histidine phosphatase family protein [Kiloniella antarctica]|uniref:Histidine phosphatase family protein n=1 Tax=Kiloniella antarctica TaxID=1550907 RepID=A0ABW5BHH3_9PROT
MSEILILRHGPTIWNLEKRMQGRSDIPLSPEGQNQVGQWSLPDEWYSVPWYVSPLKRAQKTAQIMGKDSITTEPRLSEMSWGEWEGKRLPELRENLGPQLQKMEDMGLDLLPPGGESPRQVQQRLAPFLLDLGRQNLSAVCVAHKGIIRAIYASASGWNMLGKPPQKLQDNCAHLFKITQSGQVEVSVINLSLMENPQRFPLPIHSTRSELDKNTGNHNAC